MDETSIRIYLVGRKYQTRERQSADEYYRSVSNGKVPLIIWGGQSPPGRRIVPERGLGGGGRYDGIPPPPHYGGATTLFWPIVAVQAAGEAVSPLLRCRLAIARSTMRIERAINGTRPNLP